MTVSLEVTIDRKEIITGIVTDFTYGETTKELVVGPDVETEATVSFSPSFPTAPSILDAISSLDEALN